MNKNFVQAIPVREEAIGSQFDITTGRVVAGPAKSKIQLYETEIKGNEVYVLPEKHEQKKAA